MNESRLELRDVASGEQSVVTSLEPGDTGALLAGHAEADAPCDCRLTSRRRGEGNVR